MRRYQNFMNRKMRDDEEREREAQWPPFYRSYGVRRREGSFNKVLEICYVIIATLFILTLLGIAAFIIVMLFLYTTSLTVFLMSALIALIIFFRPISICLKRIGFSARLRRFCKKNSYTLSVTRRFPKNLRHSNESEDFVVDTGKVTYYVSFLTVSKKNARLVFLEKDKVRMTTRTLKNRLQLIYGIKPKSRDIDFVFPHVPKNGLAHKKRVGVILLDRAPSHIYICDKDGAQVRAGTGDVAFGCRILTGTGFINTVDRESREQ